MNITTIKTASLFMSVVALTGFCLLANAATYIDLGHAAGPQCIATGVNDHGMAVGNCSSATPSAIGAPWVDNVTTSGGEISLANLDPGKPCVARGIANSGKVVGSCAHGNNISFGVSWDSSSPSSGPTQLSPLPPITITIIIVGITTRPADKSTKVSAFNQSGDIVGSSLDKNKVETVVIYLSAGGGIPRQVSDLGDNCVATSVNATLLNGYPSVAMNCPDANGTRRATVALRSSALAYSKVTLLMPAGTTLCEVVAINNQSQLAGTCAPSGSNDVPEIVFWSSPTATPIVLTMPGNAQTKAVNLNNLGHIVGEVADSQGRTQTLFWDPATGPTGGIVAVPPSGAMATVPIALADNDTIALNSSDSNQYPAGCTWIPPGPVSCIAPLSGGKKSGLSSISENGAYAVGDAKDSTQATAAVAVSLP